MTRFLSLCQVPTVRYSIFYSGGRKKFTGTVNGIKLSHSDLNVDLILKVILKEYIQSVMAWIESIVEVITPLYACALSAVVILFLSFDSNQVHCKTESARAIHTVHFQNSGHISEEKKLSNGVSNSIHPPSIQPTVELEKNASWKYKFSGHWSLLKREGFKEVYILLAF